MKTTVKLNDSFKKGNHQILILENTQWYDLEISKDKEYTLELKEIKSKRSIQQNKLMWAIIREIAKVHDEDDMKIYCDALQEARVSYTDLVGELGIEEDLRKSFRAVKILRPICEKGKQFYVYRCYQGSSKFTVEEMNKLIEIVLKWASYLDINTDLIRGEL